MPNEESETRTQEINEFLLRHFARGHLEFPMMNRSIPADMTIDGYVVRRVYKYRICLTPLQQFLVGMLIERIAAINPMLT
jgi:hypothetical protein